MIFGTFKQIEGNEDKDKVENQITDDANEFGIPVLSLIIVFSFDNVSPRS